LAHGAGWRLVADRLNAVEEVEDPAGEKRGGLGVIRRQRTVGEVVLIARVEEQLRVVEGRDDLSGGVEVSLP
jgi:hypothetical protein